MTIPPINRRRQLGPADQNKENVARRHFKHTVDWRRGGHSLSDVKTGRSCLSRSGLARYPRLQAPQWDVRGGEANYPLPPLSLRRIRRGTTRGPTRSLGINWRNAGFVGARYRWVQDTLAGGASFRAASAYPRFLPSEFSEFALEYEHTMPPAGTQKRDRLLIQNTFAVGPHRPHPF